MRGKPEGLGAKTGSRRGARPGAGLTFLVGGEFVVDGEIGWAGAELQVPIKVSGSGDSRPFT